MTHQMPLTNRTYRTVRAIFPNRYWETVEQQLRDDCGPQQVSANQFDEAAMERIWLAVLKLSSGDADRFKNAIMLAQSDWRDLLMAAGFGDTLDAHHHWASEIAA